MLELKNFDLKKENIKTLIIPVCEDKLIHDNQKIVSLIKKAKKIEEFNGKKDDELILYSPPEINAERIIFLGTGKADKLDTESFRSLTGKAVRLCIKKKIDDILIVVPCAKKAGMTEAGIIEAMLEGACLGNHVYNLYKKEKKYKPLESISLFVNAKTAKKYSSLPLRITEICKGTILAREWVSAPGNDKRPEQYAKSIADLAKKAGLGVSVLDENDLKKNKFGALLAAAQGSHAKPRLVILEYKAKGAKKNIALIGKGVTFDSGGLNLKISGAMSDMKIDMAGSASVAAALITMAAIKPKVNVTAIIPIVENMPSGSAVRPGDVITSYDGKTVEIGNTDAEGRLILIDAISYAVDKFKPHTIIDMATLTGACVIALGEKIAGVFSHDNQLADAIVESGKKTHERCWRMPLPEDYKELLKSDLADISNMSSSKWGGAITAALFLSAFVKENRWAHIDIAGPSYIKKDNNYCSSGGTGFGVRLLCDLIDKI
ncbi:putative cytosol aminopeptidase [Desulfonema limicola]|uniref:Probable cytosol aminopeptidase n=1 Tax=Desulfonema limicola TaxID=45656 RepID=A0A975B716_9BACT|nr:leucyl aminopeptidase [Desulfonema limicola]QTA79988.1 putative cytosol aminopeptidase [Desulfonema limicola]